MRKPRRMQRLSAEATEKFAKLGELLAAHDRQCWAIGDLVLSLVDKHRVPLGVISATVRYSKARLSELSVTARRFPPAQRTANFQDCLMAHRIQLKFPGLDLGVEQIRDEIAQMKGKRPGAIKAYFISRMAHADACRRGPTGPIIPSNLDRAIRWADWREVVPTLADASVKIFHADPPYAGYAWMEEGGYLSSRAGTSGLRTESDANSNAEAIEVTEALFELCRPKLMPGGCLLLWQPGARPDSPDLLDGARRAGWDFPFALTWVKSAGGVSAQAFPYAPASERLLIFTPRGARLVKHEADLSRSDVLTFPAVTTAAATQMRMGNIAPRSVHMFQKPLALMEHLIRKHSHPGELVVDLFGCSGSCCIAAQRLKRSWMYIERNRVNFEWGRSRVIDAAMSGPNEVVLQAASPNLMDVSTAHSNSDLAPDPCAPACR